MAVVYLEEQGLGRERYLRHAVDTTPSGCPLSLCVCRLPPKDSELMCFEVT